jgi:E3 ubiquitin-protein ligase RFWD2
MLSEDHHLRTSLQSDTAADDEDEHPDSNASGDTDGGYRQRQKKKKKKKGRRLSQWKFKVVATVESDDPNNSSTDVIGAIAFDKSNDFFATGGSARKIRVYAFQSLSKEDVFYDDDDEEEEEEKDADQKLRQRRRLQRKIMLPMNRKPRATTHSSSSSSRADHTSSCCMTEICTPAKLSSLKWHFERDNIIGCGDYDGVFAEWDIERHIAVSEKDEHNGQRIWSIDYSVERPSLCASASQDGTVRMWSRSSDHSVALLHAPNRSPVCGAEFAPCSSFLLALACADSNVYVNDLRKLSTPVLTLSHHKRAVSYVRFLSKDRLVSAAIDSTLKLWDVSSCVQNSPIPHCEVNHDDDESGRSHLSNILQQQQQQQPSSLITVMSCHDSQGWY